MDRDDVMRWVGEYERAWRDGELDALDALFTEDLAYRVSPYEESMTLAALKDVWCDDEDEVFAANAWPIAVDGRDAVVRVDVSYGDPVRQEYRDVWLLRFAEDGRVDDFEEWAYWPDKAYSAGSEPAE
jgi:hypothetical protein